MFVAPPEKEVEWSDAGLEGSFRFLLRVWRLVDHWAETIGGEGIPACGDDCTDAERALRRKTHDTIRRVTVDIEERMHLNTAVSSLMELVNELYAFSETTAHGAPGRARGRQSDAIERPQTIARAARGDRRAGRDAVAVRAAHGRGAVADARSRRRAREGDAGRRSIAEVAKADEVVVPVQVNGKVRARLTVPADLSDDELRDAALADPAVQSAHAGQDDPEGRGREGPARQCGGLVTSLRVARRHRVQVEASCRTETSRSSRRFVVRVCAGALRSAAAAATRWPAAARFCPAYIKTIGVPTFANRTTVFNLETLLTQKVRAEFIGRGKYAVLPQATGVDALLIGEVTGVTIAAGQLQRAATRVALRDHDDGAAWSCAICTRTRCSGRTRAWCSARNTRRPAAARLPSIRSASSARTRTRSIG